jgi:hypothetical protein
MGGCGWHNVTHKKQAWTREGPKSALAPAALTPSRRTPGAAAAPSPLFVAWPLPCPSCAAWRSSIYYPRSCRLSRSASPASSTCAHACTTHAHAHTRRRRGRRRLACAVGGPLACKRRLGPPGARSELMTRPGLAALFPSIVGASLRPSWHLPSTSHFAPTPSTPAAGRPGNGAAVRTAREPGARCASNLVRAPGASTRFTGPRMQMQPGRPSSCVLGARARPSPSSGSCRVGGEPSVRSCHNVLVPTPVGLLRAAAGAIPQARDALGAAAAAQPLEEEMAHKC